MESLKAIELAKSFIDVLYITDQEQLPLEIKRLFKQHKLSYYVLTVEKFSMVSNRLDSIGTVIIDTKNTDSSKELIKIIESLEMEHIGVILLTDRPTAHVRSFSLAPTKNSFSMGDDPESYSIDELWMRLSVNLAYRKKSSGITAAHVVTPKQVHTVYKNKMAEQLSMTRSLVDNLAEQLRLAGLVQQDFLPTKLPRTEHVQWATIFMPAEWVSGDIYDIVQIDENHLGFYVADVVGHGMPAALLTIFLKQAMVMRETIENSHRIFSPAEVVKNLNIKMAAQKLSGYQFATCCYCLLNIKTYELTFARAGHPYPILIRPGRAPEQLEIRGSLLGVFEQAEYQQRTIQLQPGDKLLLYSDGTESCIGKFNDQAGFNFTQEFTDIKHLSITQMMDGFNTIIQHREFEQAEIDDITVLGLEILP